MESCYLYIPIIQMISSFITVTYLLWKHYQIKRDLTTVSLKIDKEVSLLRKKICIIDETTFGVANVTVKALESRVNTLFHTTQELQSNCKLLMTKVAEKNHTTEVM